MIESIVTKLAAPFPRGKRDGLVECRFLVSISGAAVLLLAVYFGPLSGQF